MYCVQDGRVCVQVWNTKTEQWDIIPLAKWECMSARQRKKYDLSI